MFVGHDESRFSLSILRARARVNQKRCH